MKTHNHSSIPRLFIIIGLGFGLLMAAFSIASGNNPLVRPDMATIEKELQNNPVKAEQLAGWMVEGKRDFRVAGFRTPEACSEQKQVTKQLKCYDSSKIKDTFWIRKTFRNIHMPIIVYGTDTAEGLAAAAQLKHLGYHVRYLEDGFTGFTESLDENPTGIYFAGNDPLVKQKGQRWVIASADSAMEEEDEEVELGDDEEDEEYEEEDEEEEEGC